MKVLKVVFAIIFALSIFTGCSSSPEQEISAIVLSTNAIEISVDKTYQITYTTLPSDVKNISVSWRSTDESIVSVDETGIVIGVKEGQTNIIAECENGIYEVCSVTVTGKSAYDSLSDKEREFVDLFVQNLNIFYNPKSVTLKYYHHLKSGDIETWDITISAQNQMGGFSEEDYSMDISGKISKSILGHVQMPHWEDGCNLNLINQAIAEYVN